MNATTPQPNGYIPGLEGVVAAQTRLSKVDGLKGELIIGGFPLEVLASRATYEEVVYLLWRGELPSPAELAAFSRTLAGCRELPVAATELLAHAASSSLDVMDALRITAGTLSMASGPDDVDDEMERDALRLVGAFPTIVAHYSRLLQGEAPVAPDPELGHAANYLYMLDGERPDPGRIRGLETYLNTVVDHGLNASTFTARVILSTQSDMNSAVVGALGALKGPLHGGAPGPALDMVFEIGSADKAESFLRQKIGRGDRLMGFGHRVYKVYDPRAEVLSKAAKQLFDEREDRSLYELATAVEQIALDVLEELKPGRNLQTNVEYYTALLLHGIGMSQELFTPTFAVSRVGGWTAHGFEQAAENRLIRPSAQFVGERDRSWVPLEER